MKFLRVEMPDGSKWDVPCEVIARKRTEYYAGVDGFKEGSREWEEEFKRSMDDYELEDWASNNMNWEDVQSIARKVADLPPPEVDYQEGWVNGDNRIA